MLTVDFLKKYIWKREKNILEDLTNDSSSLSLWNVNVDEVEDVSTENDIIQNLKARKWNLTSCLVSILEMNLQ